MKHYISLVKFWHSIFALPFALIGYFVAINIVDEPIQSRMLWLIILCMVTARNAAMGFNRYLDRDIDAKNPRTRTREIPAGIISARSGLIFVIVNSLLFIATSYLIRPICLYLSPVALLVILGYSYMKRISSLCHFVLSLGLALAPTGAYLAVTGEFALLPTLLSILVFLWVSGFDIIYSSQDADFDRREGLRSVPSQFGVGTALMISRTLHFLTAIVILYIGLIGDFSFIYWIGSALFILLLIRQQLIVSEDDLSKVDLAFGTFNGVGSVVYALFTILSLYF